MPDGSLVQRVAAEAHLSIGADGQPCQSGKLIAIRRDRVQRPGRGDVRRQSRGLEHADRLDDCADAAGMGQVERVIKGSGVQIAVENHQAGRRDDVTRPIDLLGT